MAGLGQPRYAGLYAKGAVNRVLSKPDEIQEQLLQVLGSRLAPRSWIRWSSRLSTLH